ncbi:hypothetical protein DC74_1452 [Streptomyces noursei]|nr:hypothetical protein DC74_1452 [Streptomyces noursei]
MTARASASRPCPARCTGDSGTPRRTQNSSSAGTLITASIHRQLSAAGSSPVETSPHSVTPIGHQASSAVSTRPRYRRGANSPTSA